jgi:hypothetical protein
MKKLLLTSLLTLFSLCLFAQVPNYVPTNGLVGWWPFNGNAIDESVNTNDGTVNGATLTTDRNGIANSAYSFDGIDDWIEIANNIALNFSINQQYSLSFWFFISNSTTNIGDAICNWENSYNPYSFKVNFSSGDVNANGPIMNAARYGGGTIQNQTTVQSINDTVSYNQFNHITLTFSQSTGISYFLNGSFIGNSNINNIATISNNYPLFFGRRGISTNRFYAGKLDDIGIWNRALTQCEIADLYNAQFGSLNSTSTQTQTALDSYTWTQNGQTYTQSGTYTQIIPNAAGCDSTITLDLTLSFTGMIELNGSTLTLSPNPVEDVVSILVDSKLIGEEFTIIDQLGAIVLKETLKSEKTEIDLSKYSSGMYLFRLTNYSEKVIRVLKK